MAPGLYKLIPGCSCILASSSPRRRELIAATGIAAEVRVPDVDESILPGEQAAELVARLSHRKASLIAEREPAHWVIGGDTVVVLDGQILGKPLDSQEAEQMLLAMQGRTHEVVGGLSVVCRTASYEATRVSHTVVTMARLSPTEVAAYVRTGEPLDKAGSYALQGIGLSFVTRIEGSMSNVVGLDVPVLIELLQQAGSIEVQRQ